MSVSSFFLSASRRNGPGFEVSVDVSASRVSSPRCTVLYESTRPAHAPTANSTWKMTDQAWPAICPAPSESAFGSVVSSPGYLPYLARTWPGRKGTWL